MGHESPELALQAQPAHLCQDQTTKHFFQGGPFARLGGHGPVVTLISKCMLKHDHDLHD